MPLTEVIQFVSNLVKQTGIRYVTVGGVAASAFSEPRATKDVDLVILISPADVEGFLDRIEAMGLPVSRRESVLGKLKEGKPAKIVWDKKFSFDLRLASYSIDESALERAQTVHIPKYGETLKVATPEDVIVYKLARFEDIDRRDIKSLLRHNQNLDRGYIERQAQLLSEEAGKPEILKHLEEARALGL